MALALLLCSGRGSGEVAEHLLHGHDVAVAAVDVEEVECVRERQAIVDRLLGHDREKVVLRRIDGGGSDAVRRGAAHDDQCIHAPVDEKREERRPQKSAELLLVDDDLVRERLEVGDDLRPVGAGKIEFHTAADTGADLAVEHADIVVHRIDDIARKEDRNARCSRGVEQPGHLINGGKRRFAAGKGIFRGVVRGAANARHVILAVDQQEGWRFAESGALTPAPTRQDCPVLRRQNGVPIPGHRRSSCPPLAEERVQITPRCRSSAIRPPSRSRRPERISSVCSPSFGPARSTLPGVSLRRGTTFATTISPSPSTGSVIMFPRAANCGSSKMSRIELTGPHGTCASAHILRTSAAENRFVQSPTKLSTASRSASRLAMLPHLPEPESSGCPTRSAKRWKILSLVHAMATHLPSAVG